MTHLGCYWLVAAVKAENLFREELDYFQEVG
jgi:hypothetical protein